MAGDLSNERFERLFDGQFDRCRRLAFRIVHDEAVAEEVAAEAFARAWSRWSRLAHDDRVDGWVIRVTVNLAIDLRRRRRQQPETGSPSAPQDAVLVQLVLVDALRSLPRRQAQAVALRFLADMSEADVAAALGVSSGSVKTHVHRGLRRLRAALGDDYDLEVHLVDRT